MTHELFGDQVPFGDPHWYQGQESPYYNDSHKKFRAQVREFVEKELMPYVHKWDEEGDYPMELHDKAYKSGILGAMFPKEYGGTPPENVDAFHDLIMCDELCRVGGAGILWAVFYTMTIGLPPILNADRYLKDKVAKDVITGKKLISLAVTEPYAGSDVANIRTTAIRDGDHYIVNGEKKFITGGIKADYYTTAVRTGGEGIGGISFLLIEKNTPGITTRRLKTNGWWTSNTAYINFENVKVPVANLIGKENDGFKCIHNRITEMKINIMLNFNHERFLAAVMGNRMARVCLEDAYTYATQRVAFGKPLIQQPVIRQKLAEMARLVESNHAFIEQIAYQLKCKVSDQKIVALVALAKVNTGKITELCAREASQILGGNSCIRGGKGERVERIYREVRIGCIGAGTEEVMQDLAIRQSMRLSKL